MSDTGMVSDVLIMRGEKGISPSDSGILIDAVWLQVVAAQPIEICFGGVSGLDLNRAYSLLRVRIFYGINSKISDRY